MGKQFSHVFLGCILCLLLAAACAGTGKEVADRPAMSPETHSALKRVSGWSVPDLSDDMSLTSLVEAVRASMEYYEGADPDKTFRFGKDHYKAGDLKKSLEDFLALMEKATDEKEKRELIKSRFHLYRGGGKRKDVLFTGYYEPVLYGSRLPGIDYMVPIYSVPSDLITVDLKNFLPGTRKKRIVGRYQNGKLVPYYTRYEIDRLQLLGGRGYEIAWVQDPVEAFFLHIQGSGRIVFPDGSMTSVHYAGSNGRSYRSIGKLLTKTGKIPKEQMSMQALKSYLKDQPAEVDRTLEYNESYIFFEEVAVGPLGSAGVLLTPGRSIATDSSAYPPGALVYIETEIPVLGEEGPTSWKKIRRFMLNQDTGGAIRGPRRADIYWGSGEAAGQVAGWMNRTGRMYFLAPKQ